MALAGLHNISAFGPSFFVESQSPGSYPRRQVQRRGNIGVVSEVSNETENQGLATVADMTCEDNESVISEQSSDLGEVERGRVRQIFKEWMDSGSEGHSRARFQPSNQMGPQCVGENVCDRGRNIREWIRMNAQNRNNNDTFRDEVTGICSQNELVHNRIVNIQTDIGRGRPMRRLYGRQTLQDLLRRAQSERNRELQALAVRRPVSDFAHRNRIQALLRGRFLRNEIPTLEKRQSSVAATELGLLGKRCTVSNLREGFLSKFHNSGSTPIICAEPSSSYNHENNGELESPCTGREGEICAALDLESAPDEQRSQHEFGLQTNDVEEVLDYDVNVRGVALDVESAHSIEEETALACEISRQEVSANVECTGITHSEPDNATSTNQLSLESVDMNYSGPNEVSHEPCEPSSGDNHAHELVDWRTTYIEGSTNDNFGGQDVATQLEEVQESESEIEGSSWRQLSVSFTEGTGPSGDDVARSWQENSANTRFQDISVNDVTRQVQESHEDWSHSDLREAIDSWLETPSREITSYVGGSDTFYFSDSDNDHSMELRELLSRRRVSRLLRSSFRESLDQMLQSHAERLGGHASGDWELENPSPILIEQDPDYLSGAHAWALSDGVDINSANPLSNRMSLSLPLWAEELPGSNWPHNYSDLHLGTEWELINELRVDMARLHLRMNNMQSMLEACMELQTELQRSVHQEVSAALNQSVISRDAGSANTSNNESQWDFVRKGICCLCRASNIDSLLYRCGHMCTCAKCAELLLQGMGTCPMCKAPIAEVVRAYFIQ